MRDVSIFEYRYIPEVVTVLEKLKNIGIQYIEISPIVPIDSEIKLPIKKEFNNKGVYTIAGFDANFNIINQLLLKKKFDCCFTAVKGLFEGEECNFIFIQCIEKQSEKIKDIIDYLNSNKYSYKLKNEEDFCKIVMKI